MSPSAEMNGTHSTKMQPDFDKYWSDKATRFADPVLRNIVKQFSGLKDVIGMHGGIPPAEVLPLTNMTLKLLDGTTVEIDDKDDLWFMQQYQYKSVGCGYIVEWAEQHMKDQHNPPGNHEVMMSLGNMHSLSTVMDLLLNFGDPFLTEEYLFSSVLDGLAKSKGIIPVPVPTDNNGIIPEQLEKTLTDYKEANGFVPKFLYIITCGQNPTGIRYSKERIDGIYAVCRQHGVLIVEDDPYYYCQFPSDGNQDNVPGLELGPTFLSVDEDSRVIRLDSFSKFFMCGCRLGWISAHPEIIQKCALVLTVETIGANCIAQIAFGAIMKKWGRDGFESYVKSLQRVYTRKSHVAISACEEYLSGLVEFQRPSAGMFLWLKMLHVEDFWDINEDLKSKGVVVVPGAIFSPLYETDSSFKSPYLRLCFTYCTDEQLVEGIQRLATVLKTKKTED
eukprot:TRINITY_DN2274_c0_g1_i1.p1 TRINITY_DN2274_c0_g1~~TRINITY_DN2274_c0_g1_i1.p1  ORF type:complete len:447 (-),score=41.82 TRINITY_DN2274_c0_g1_i1:376-1716(-)